MSNGQSVDDPLTSELLTGCYGVNPLISVVVVGEVQSVLHYVVLQVRER